MGGGGGRVEECADKYFQIPDVRISLCQTGNVWLSATCDVSEVLFVVDTKDEKMAVLRIYLTCVLVFYLILTVSVQHFNYRATNLNPPIMSACLR